MTTTSVPECPICTRLMARTTDAILAGDTSSTAWKCIACDAPERSTVVLVDPEPIGNIGPVALATVRERVAAHRERRAEQYGPDRNDVELEQPTPIDETQCGRCGWNPRRGGEHRCTSEKTTNLAVHSDRDEWVDWLKSERMDVVAAIVANLAGVDPPANLAHLSPDPVTAYVQGAATDRARTRSIIREYMPHTGHCSMDDCDGCEAIDVLLAALDGGPTDA